MKEIHGFLDESAEWASGFSLADAPPSVVETAKILVADTLAAAFSSLNTGPGLEVCRELKGVLGEAEAVSAMSVLLDHDSTLLYYGHVGHSAVPAPLLGSRGIDGQNLLEAVIASAEVGARLAASLSFSRARGQMLTIVHSLISAVAMAKASETPASRVGRAMALSLAYTVKPTRSGFASEAKILAAANGVSTGLRAYRLAQAGARGPTPRVLEDLHREWGGVVLREPLGGYGARWHLETLSVKPWPACSYAQTAIEAALRIAGDLDPREVREVVVEGSALTYYMDRSHEPAVRGPETPFTVLQFYTPYIVAYTLSRGSFGREAYEPESLGDSGIWRLAARTRSTHQARFTAKLLEEPLPFGVAIRELGPLKTLGAMVKLLGPKALALAAANPGILRGHRLDEVRMQNTRKQVPVRIRVRTASQELEAEAWIVKGFHGTGIDSKRETATRKLLESAGKLLGEEDARTLADIVSRLEKAGPDEVGILVNLTRRALRC